MFLDIYTYPVPHQTAISTLVTRASTSDTAHKAVKLDSSSLCATALRTDWIDLTPPTQAIRTGPTLIFSMRVGETNQGVTPKIRSIGRVHSG
jgi:hypothetical protein